MSGSGSTPTKPVPAPRRGSKLKEKLTVVVLNVYTKFPEKIVCFTVPSCTH